MLLSDWLDEALRIAGLVIAGTGAIFAWRVWVRGRRLYAIELTTWRRHKGEGEMQRDDALYLGVVVRCRRNRIRIQRIAITGKGGKPLPMASAFAPSLAPPRTVEEGNYALATFWSDDIAEFHRGPQGPARKVCWWDAENTPHCEGISKAMLADLLADAKM